MAAAVGTIGTEELMDALGRVAEWAAASHPMQYREAVDAFELMARPACIYEDEPAEDIVEATGAAFTEWWLFEAAVDGDGRTALRAYADGGDDEATRGVARELADTQRFGQFAVLALDPEGGSAVMVSCGADNALLRVYGEHVACYRGWRRGLVACRVAEVGGVPRLVSLLPMHDNAGDPSRPDPDGGDFLAMVRKTIGVDGEFAESVRVRREG